MKYEGNIRYFLSPGQGKFTGNMIAGSNEGNIVPSFTMPASVLGCLITLCLLPKTSVNPIFKFDKGFLRERLEITDTLEVLVQFEARGVFGSSCIRVFIGWVLVHVL